VILLALCLAGLAGPGTIQADDAALGAVGHAVTPLENSHITMTTERVVAEIEGGEARVTCAFTFANQGPSTDVLMGFPVARATHGDTTLHDFTATVDGEPLDVTYRPDANPDSAYAGWHTFVVPFGVGETRVVKNSYRGPLSQVSNGGRFFEYVLETGATWAGPIGRAEVVVRWAGTRDVRAKTLNIWPEGYEQGQNELRWVWHDIEPTQEDNVHVYFYPTLGPRDIGRAASSLTQKPLPAGSYRGVDIPFADGDPTTAWVGAVGDASPWLIWSYGDMAHHATPSLGIGLQPILTAEGELDERYGRPREVVVALARAADPGALPPAIPADPAAFVEGGEGWTVERYRLTLEDRPLVQYLRLDEPETVLAVQIVIESIYAGTAADTVALGEVWFPLLADELGHGKVVEAVPDEGPAPRLQPMMPPATPPPATGPTATPIEPTATPTNETTTLGEPTATPEGDVQPAAGDVAGTPVAGDPTVTALSEAEEDEAPTSSWLMVGAAAAVLGLLSLAQRYRRT
jgi:hypothetical protein